MKPILFATGHAPAYRAGAFALLHEREDVEFALFGGRSKHGGGNLEDELPFPHRHPSGRELAALAASGRYRAVVCPTGGRVAPLASWAGARRARVPLILWASLWAHPRSPAHALSYLPLRRLYRSADAIVTYGPHVSDYVRARGARNVHVAPQSVDNDFWSSPDVLPPGDPTWPSSATTRFLFVGRPAREKGLEVLLASWRACSLERSQAALVLAGVGSNPPAWTRAAIGVGDTANGVHFMDAMPAHALRDVYAASDVLVLPSIPTRTFREPWGLVVNEAMNRRLPVIASDAVGAAAGGLVQNRRNGLVVAAGDAAALAQAIGELSREPALRARLGHAGAQDVIAYSHEAWAEGFSRALASVGASRAA
ncbi:MAG TPA: glycosyltransferase family 4 protein [Solirubrobacteraceae bacterium]|nr:glycosyltransferase family 4 protein [Solirubrobacteraceae bacterium]